MKSTIVQSAKSLSLVVLLIIVGAMFTACSDKELITDPRQDANAAQTYTMVVNATKGDDASTRALSLDDKTLNATWAEGEEVTVYNMTTYEELNGTLSAQSSGSSTTLKGSLSSTKGIHNGDHLLLKFLSPDYASQDGTLVYIAAHCDYAEAFVYVTDASTSNVTTEAASFWNRQAIVCFTLKNKTNSESLYTNSLKISDGTQTYTVNRSRSATPYYVAIPGFSGTISMIAFDGDTSYEYTKSGVSFSEGQYYEISVKMVKLNGKFSVSSTKQVYFSKGNVQATNTSANSTGGWKWSFAEHQYDYIGNATANNAVGHGMVSVAGTVDLFGYVGTSSNWYSAAKYGVTNSTATGQRNGYGNVAGEAPNEWGNNFVKGWRTLTYEEWDYLMNTRDNAANKVGFATVAGKYGLILLPDVFTDPMKNNGSGAFVPMATTGYDANIYATGGDWEAMESNGAIFLPAAGERYNGSIDLETWGFYWTSSSPEDAGAFAKVLSFYNSNVTINTHSGRAIGHSVRLVYDAN